ncbi:MAG: undecaprenyl-diphosphate phosphatase, partial [Patescibacteria group bacterium]
MSIFDAIILGIIEGLTEFLPVSSTGHLIVVERLLGIREPSLFFNTVIQLGAILAAVMYLRKQIIELFRDLFVVDRQKKPLLFLLATIPVLVIGFVFHPVIEQFQKSVIVVGVMSILIALLFAWGERAYAKSLKEGLAGTTQNKLGWKEFLSIGLWQSLSVIPGVSRSGITVFGGITKKLS